jgi:Tfp pilus assembly protein PilF
MEETYLSRGIAAVKAGQKNEARTMLITAVKADPNCEQAWG